MKERKRIYTRLRLHNSSTYLLLADANCVPFLFFAYLFSFSIAGSLWGYSGGKYGKARGKWSLFECINVCLYVICKISRVMFFSDFSHRVNVSLHLHVFSLVKGLLKAHTRIQLCAVRWTIFWMVFSLSAELLFVYIIFMFYVLKIGERAFKAWNKHCSYRKQKTKRKKKN